MNTPQEKLNKLSNYRKDKEFASYIEQVSTNEKIEELIQTVKETQVEPVAQQEYPKFPEEISIKGVNLIQIKGDKGDDGYTPVKGVDYFDGKDGKDGYTPIKNKDYFDGKDGKTPKIDYDKIKSEIILEIPIPKDGKNGKDGSPDTREEIVNKINSGKEKDTKIKSEQIEGLEKFSTQENLDRAIGILDQRTQFLINKRSGGGGVQSVVAGTNVTVDNTDPQNPVVSSTGGGTPGGSDTQLQYNNSGAFGGISGATTNGTSVTYTTSNLIAADIKASGSGGFSILSNAGTTTALFGAGGGANSTFYGGLKADYATASTIGIFDASKNLISASTTTYPDLTELSYLKGVTSSIQTQLNAKGTGTVTGTGTAGQVSFWSSASAQTGDNDLFWDNTNKYLGIGQATPTSRLHIETNALGTTQTNTSGLALINTTAAANGAQQISPALRFSSNGWGTTAGTSRDVSFRMYSTPIQGGVPTGSFNLQSSIAGSAYADNLIVRTDGFTKINANSSQAVTIDKSGSFARIVSDTALQFQSQTSGLMMKIGWIGSDQFTFYSTGYMRIGTSAYTPTSKLDISTQALGTTQTADSGLALTNNTAAAAGAQQISPAIRWSGKGWKTNATAASQSVDFRSYVVPVQGAANPTGYLTFESQINGGGYSEVARVTNTGVFTTTADIISGGTVRLKSYTVATLPTTPTQGDTAFVTDATAPTYLGVAVGGGAVVAPVFYDGTNWITH
jgi:hypothetical protein